MRVPDKSYDEYVFLAEAMEQIGELRLENSFREEAKYARNVEEYAHRLAATVDARGSYLNAGLRLITQLIEDGWTPPEEVPNG
ncbi:hypothetical protein ACWCPQ_14325 [Nocardia sp. NPDC001965]